MPLRLAPISTQTHSLRGDAAAPVRFHGWVLWLEGASTACCSCVSAWSGKASVFPMRPPRGAMVYLSMDKRYPLCSAA